MGVEAITSKSPTGCQPQLLPTQKTRKTPKFSLKDTIGRWGAGGIGKAGSRAVYVAITYSLLVTQNFYFMQSS